MLNAPPGLPRVAIGENATLVIYLLPVHFHLFYAVEDLCIYAITYALQLPMLIITSFVAIAEPSIMVTLVFHICGQMSVLALRINNINVNLFICRREIQNVVRNHIRLLRWAFVLANCKFVWRVSFLSLYCFSFQLLLLATFFRCLTYRFTFLIKFLGMKCNIRKK